MSTTPKTPSATTLHTEGREWKTGAATVRTESSEPHDGVGDGAREVVGVTSSYSREDVGTISYMSSMANTKANSANDSTIPRASKVFP